MRQTVWFSSEAPKPGTQKGPLQVDTWLRGGVGGSHRSSKTTTAALDRTRSWRTRAFPSEPGSGLSFLPWESWCLRKAKAGDSQPCRWLWLVPRVPSLLHQPHLFGTLCWYFYATQSRIYDISHKNLDSECPDVTSPNH